MAMRLAPRSQRLASQTAAVPNDSTAIDTETSPADASNSGEVEDLMYYKKKNGKTKHLQGVLHLTNQSTIKCVNKVSASGSYCVQSHSMNSMLISARSTRWFIMIGQKH